MPASPSFVTPAALLRPRFTAASAHTCKPHMTSSDSAGPAAGVNYGRIQHAGVLVRDTTASMRFYTGVLGMTDDTPLRNPKLPFAGAFVRAGSSQIHLMELPNPDPLDGRPEHGGRDRHVAVTVDNLDPLIESLDSNDWRYTFSKSGRRAVFTRDLDSNALEFIEDPSASP